MNVDLVPFLGEVAPIMMDLVLFACFLRKFLSLMVWIKSSVTHASILPLIVYIDDKRSMFFSHSFNITVEDCTIYILSKSLKLKSTNLLKEQTFNVLGSPFVIF